MILILEYVWLDCDDEFRTKTKVLPFPQHTFPTLSDIPVWNYDGSSTGQAPSDGITEVILKPVCLKKNPFIKDFGYLVLCECMDSDGKPIATNKCSESMKMLRSVDDKDIWFGIELEFFFEDSNNKMGPQGKYYCGIGQTNYEERKIMETLVDYCNTANLIISGFNQEVAPHQWEYQIGPISATWAPHGVYLSRYILDRIAEQYGKKTNWHPKPHNGDYNGSGCHINISSNETRAENGLNEIYKVLKVMESDHVNFIKIYSGKNNDMRLTGAHETSDPMKFTFSKGGRGSSIRIPTQVMTNECGYFEDRRPGSSINYYETLAKYAEYFKNAINL
jgi:glutamine synthetase